MSTMAIIGTIDARGFYAGRPVCCDGNPEHMGPALVGVLANFDGGLEQMLKVILDDHPVWGSISPSYPAELEGFDVNQGYVAVKGVGRAHKAHRNGYDDAWEQGRLGSGEDGSWGYYFTTSDVTTAELIVADGTDEIFRMAVRDLPSLSKTDWLRIECGHQFERCTHVAWYHEGRQNIPKASQNLAMVTWLGLDPLTAQDAIGAIVGGKTYRFGFSGYSRGDRWFATGVRYANGRKAPDLPWRTSAIYNMVTREHIEPQPLPGVELIFPPTLKDVIS